jgi:cytoskeleton protein RodZ
LSGEIFKKRREELGLDINEVSDTLKISSEYLISIENDMFDRLPVAVYTVGYIRCYAKYLEVDAGPVISDFTSHLASPTKPSTIIPVSSSRRKVPVYVYAILLLIAGLSAFAVYTYTREYGPNLTKVTAVEKVVPSVKEKNIMPVVPLPSNSEPVTKADVPLPLNNESAIKSEDIKPAGNNMNESVPAVAVQGEHQLEVTASSAVWLRIRFENGKQEEMLFKSGESKTWKFAGPAVLKLGNAGGVTLKLDGKDLGVPGDPGKVLELTLPQS